ncbi:hypothetical protein A2U01_0080523, partial [Trifolium medium]|nr:hypothetical protein [Trifolium medium]
MKLIENSLISDTTSNSILLSMCRTG